MPTNYHIYVGWNAHEFHKIILSKQQLDEFTKIVEKEIKNGNNITTNDIGLMVHYNNIIKEPKQRQCNIL